MIPYLRLAILSDTYLPRPYMGFPLPPKTSRVTWQVNWTWIWTTNARVFWIQIYEMIHILFLVTCHRKFHVSHKKVILVGHVINQGKKTCMFDVACFMEVLHVWPKKIIWVYNKVRWNFYKLRQLSLLQSAMDSITNCDSFFITKCDTVYYKLRQVLQSAMIITNCDSTGSRFCDVICAQRYLTYWPLKVDWLIDCCFQFFI